MKNKIKVVIVAIILAIITLALLSALGRTYTVKVPLKSVENLDEVNVVLEQDDNYLEIVDTNLKDNELSVKLHSKKSGKAHFIVLDENNEDIFLDVLYVNDLGVITQNGYFGYSNGSIVIPIFTSVFIAYSLYILINFNTCLTYLIVCMILSIIILLQSFSHYALHTYNILFL